MKHSLYLLFFIVVLALPSIAQTGVRIGTPAPAFAGTGMDGTAYELGQMRGKVVVMTFWSTRCAICHYELPKLNQFADRFGADKVVLLALSMENEEKINGFLKHNTFKFRIVPNSFGTVLSYADRDRHGNLDMGFPSFFVIDQEGVVRHRASGYDKTESMAAVVGKLLAK